MQRTLFTIPVRDLERSDQRRRWELPPDWIDWALSESEARSDGSLGVLEVYLKKTGREVLVKGEVHASVMMPCARTLEDVPVKLDADIYLLLSPRKAAAEGGGRGGRGRRQVAADGEERDELLSAEMAARDEYDGETVTLDAFVREHLLLELPLFPVKSDLPFDPAPATDTPPDESGASAGHTAKAAVDPAKDSPDPSSATPTDTPVDPRLAPLAALANELQRTGKIGKSNKE